MRTIVGKKTQQGITPAVALMNPKYPRNVGQAIRASSCFGIKQLWYTGNRVALEIEKGHRVPREQRMRQFSDVKIYQHDYIFEQFNNAVPVAIEITPNSEILTTFEHPENALYIFGPEDGSIPQVAMRHCHRFVAIPTSHCTNLAAAIYIVLYDRLQKRQLNGLEDIKPVCEILKEPREWSNFEDKTGLSRKTLRKQPLQEMLL